MDWPVAALIFGLVCLLLFHKQIGSAVSRLTKVSKEGATFEGAQVGREINTGTLSFVELMKLPVSNAAHEREKFILQQIENLKLQTEAQKSETLIRALAVQRIELEFTYCAWRIFGSQLNLLVALSGTNQGMTKQQVEALFEKAKTEFPTIHVNRTFDEWIEYLKTNHLIYFKEEKIDISAYGTDFLKHLVDARLAYPRIG